MTHTGPADKTRKKLISDLDVAMCHACSPVMNRLAPHCPPLSWSPDDRGNDAAVAAVQAWASEFDLQLNPDPTTGTIRYDGAIHGLPVKEAYA